MIHIYVKDIFQNPSLTLPNKNPYVTFSDGVYAQDSFSNTPIACNGKFLKSDVQIYKKGICFNIPPSTNPTYQAKNLCNFKYTVTSFTQNQYGYVVPTFVANSETGNSTFPGFLTFQNLAYQGCSYQLLLDVG